MSTTDLTGRHVTIWHGPEVDQGAAEALFDHLASEAHSFAEDNSFDVIVMGGPTDSDGRPA